MLLLDAIWRQIFLGKTWEMVFGNLGPKICSKCRVKPRQNLPRIFGNLGPNTNLFSWKMIHIFIGLLITLCPLIKFSSIYSYFGENLQWQCKGVLDIISSLPMLLNNDPFLFNDHNRASGCPQEFPKGIVVSGLRDPL